MLDRLLDGVARDAVLVLQSDGGGQTAARWPFAGIDPCAEERCDLQVDRLFTFNINHGSTVRAGTTYREQVLNLWSRAV
jgi:hypothetical protein